MESPGLRERKKLRTRREIRQAAYRLFAEHGYDATDVDTIAAAAEVSRSTFFRYFPTKEDVVLTDEYNDLAARELAARPADEPIVRAVQQSMTTSLAHLMAADRDELMFRMQLMAQVPAIRARAMEEQLQTQDLISDMIAQRTGRDDADLDVRCAAAAIIGISSAVIQYWVEGGAVDDLVALYDRQLGRLASGLEL